MPHPNTRETQCHICGNYMFDVKKSPKSTPLCSEACRDKWYVEIGVDKNVMLGVPDDSLF